MQIGIGWTVGFVVVALLIGRYWDRMVRNVGPHFHFREETRAYLESQGWELAAADSVLWIDPNDAGSNPETLYTALGAVSIALQRVGATF